MYVPSFNQLHDPEMVRRLMVANPFATVVSNTPEGPFATHIPVLVEDGEVLSIAAHVARANPHWRILTEAAPTLVMFNGPHAYISPRHYAVHGSVPTWNYATVHCYGHPELIEDEDEALAHVREVVKTFDPNLGSDRPASMDETMLRRMLRGIVAFRMRVDRFEAKLKLNQNKTPEDRAGVVAALMASEFELDREVARLMDEIDPNNPPRPSAPPERGART